MKKIICALLAATMFVGLCACGTKNRETEVTTKKTTKATETSGETEDDEQTETTEGTAAFVDPRTRIEVEEGSVPIAMDGMSADEIVASLETYTYIYDGDTLADYGNRFELKPTGISYLTLDFFYEDYEDGVTNINFNSVSLDEATGKITIGERSSVSVDIKIQDNELAKEVYDKMIEAYSAYDIFQDVRPEDNSWYSTSRRFGIEMNFYRDNSAWIKVTRFLVD